MPSSLALEVEARSVKLGAQSHAKARSGPSYRQHQRVTMWSAGIVLVEACVEFLRDAALSGADVR